MDTQVQVEELVVEENAPANAEEAFFQTPVVVVDPAPAPADLPEPR